MIPIPLRDDNRTSRVPLVTIALIVINALVWFFEVSQGTERIVLGYGAIPACVLHDPTGICRAVVPIGRHVLRITQLVPSWWTILTSMFLHGSWMHIIGNMWFLWIFGDNIEDAMGHFRYIFFYLLCGLAAAGAQILATPSSGAPMVGASGAIAGVLGGYLLLFPRARVRCLWILIIFITFIDLPAWILLGLWFLSQFFVPMGAGVATMAHVGGFLAGLGLVRLFVKSRPIRPERIVWQ